MIDSQLAKVDAGSFRPLRTGNSTDLYRQRPAAPEPYLQFQDGKEFACFVHNRALRKMATWGRAAGKAEVLGRLGGRHCRDANGPYLLMEDAVLCREARGAAGCVTADKEAVRRLVVDFERECRPFESVGWWHTHPDSIGLFYSATDRENQATWTNQNCVGIVLNPNLTGEALKVFRGPKSIEMQPLSDRNVLDGLRTLLRGAVAEASGVESNERSPRPREISYANPDRFASRTFISAAVVLVSVLLIVDVAHLCLSISSRNTVMALLRDDSNRVRPSIASRGEAWPAIAPQVRSWTKPPIKAPRNDVEGDFDARIDVSIDGDVAEEKDSSDRDRETPYVPNLSNHR